MVIDELNWNDVSGGRNSSRVARAADAMEKHGNQTYCLVECGDENTGVRFGRAKCRNGRCAKIGGGGRNKGNRWAYQVWIVWTT